jgi:hypothetical protein
LSMSMSKLTTSPPKAFISLYNLSPFVTNFHKRYVSFDTKGCSRDRWLTHESWIFYGHHLICWNDTTCSPWDTSCRVFWSWYQLVGHLPLYHSMGHSLDKLEFLYVRELSSFYDHLKLRITCGTTIWCVRYHLYEYHLYQSDNLDIPHVRTIMEPLVGFVNYNHFLNTCYLHELLLLTQTRLICLSFQV